MPKEKYHPNAFLSNFKNVKFGLRARTIILNVLERETADAKFIAKSSSLPYSVVMYHLKLLEHRGIVQRKGKPPFTWELTGLGQTRLQ